MADETIVNGVAWDVHDQTPVDDGILKTDRDLDLVKDDKVSELNRMIEALEQEKSRLLREDEESKEKIKLLTDEIEGYKRNLAEMKERLDEMQKEIDGSKEDKKALLALAPQALELETQVFRLQHDREEALSELGELKQAFEELEKSNREKESKVEDLEREKVSLLERINREVEEVKKSKAEDEIRIRDLEEKVSIMEAREVKISEKEHEILGFQKEKKETATLKSSLEQALKLSEEKFKEMEAKANRLQSELEESEKVIKELKEMNSEMIDAESESAEKGLNSLKLKWPAALASTGTVAAAATVLYLSYAKRR